MAFASFSICAEKTKKASRRTSMHSDAFVDKDKGSAKQPLLEDGYELNVSRFRLVIIP